MEQKALNDYIGALYNLHMGCNPQQYNLGQIDAIGSLFDLTWGRGEFNEKTQMVQYTIYCASTEQAITSRAYHGKAAAID